MKRSTPCPVAASARPSATRPPPSRWSRRARRPTGRECAEGPVPHGVLDDQAERVRRIAEPVRGSGPQGVVSRDRVQAVVCAYRRGLVTW